MIEKKHWDEMLTSSIEQLRMAEMAVEQFKCQIELAKIKIKEFDDEEEKDEMPGELKELFNDDKKSKNRRNKTKI